MHPDDLSDLAAFVAVAELSSCTRAATRLGMSQSALSRAVRALESRYGVPLLARTTRSVATTEFGQALFESVRPSLQAIEGQLTNMESWRVRPAGRLRLTMIRQAAITVLWPVLRDFLANNPEVEVEIVADDQFMDIVSCRFDAGIRFGQHIDRDMVAMPLGGPMRAAVVGAPHYLSRYKTPEHPSDLARHRCINYRLPGGGPIYQWRFQKGTQVVEMSVNGGPILNDGMLIQEAALDGMGLAYLFEDQVDPYLESGRLIRVLEPWCAPFPGYHLYYPERRQVRPALRTLIDTLRARFPLPTSSSPGAFSPRVSLSDTM